MFKKIWYYPGDCLASRVTARQRRALAAWILIICIFPGIPFWYLFRHAIWLIGFMSIIALILAMWGVLSAETPVEEEIDGNDINGEV